MTVKELNTDQLNELRWNLYWDENFDSSDYYDGNHIPDDVVFKHYEGIDFVPDDFFCTACPEPEWKRHERLVIQMIYKANQGKTVYHFDVNFEEGYHFPIRTNYPNITTEDATKLLPAEHESYGRVTGVYPISVEDMVKEYDCENYKEWEIFSKPTKE